MKKYSRMHNCEKFFLALASETKIKIISCLREDEKPVNRIAADINVERSNVSHALSDLLRCGIVFVNKKGKRRYYRLNEDTFKPLLNHVDTHMKKYCKNCKKIK